MMDRITSYGTRALAALTLSLSLAACGNPVEREDHHEAAGLVVEDAQGAVLARVDQNRAVTGGITLKSGEAREVRVFFVEADGERIALDGREFSLRATVQNTGVATWTKLAEDRGRIGGASAGSTTIRFDMMHGGHPDYRGEPIPVTVTQ